MLLLLKENGLINLNNSLKQKVLIVCLML